jgi:hypothetical protein
VSSCKLEKINRQLEGKCREGGSRLVRNVVKLLSSYTVSHPIKLHYSLTHGSSSQIHNTSMDTRWCSWSKHCATSREVAGSLPNGVTGIFHWHNPSGRTTALGSMQHLKEMNTRKIYWWVKSAGAQGWQPYHLLVPIILTSNFQRSQSLSRPVMGLLSRPVIGLLSRPLMGPL